METGWNADVNTPAALREGRDGWDRRRATAIPVRKRSANPCDAVEFRERVLWQLHFGGREVFPQVRDR